MKKKDSLTKLKKTLREERLRADGNYAAYDRIREKYSDLVSRMERVKHDTRFVKEVFNRIASNLNILNK